MDPKPLEIYRVQTRLNLCDDARWCVILDPEYGDDWMKIAVTSTQFTLVDAQPSFIVEDTDPDFPATGRPRRFYIIGNFVHEKKSNLLGSGPCGRMEGDLASRFEEWAYLY